MPLITENVSHSENRKKFLALFFLPKAINNNDDVDDDGDADVWLN